MTKELALLLFLSSVYIAGHIRKWAEWQMVIYLALVVMAFLRWYATLPSGGSR